MGTTTTTPGPRYSYHRNDPMPSLAAYFGTEHGVAYYDIEDGHAPATQRVLARLVRIDAARLIVDALNTPG